MHRYVLVILLSLLVTGELLGQNADEKFLKNQTLKKIRKNIDINQKKGYIPMDLTVSERGRFSVRMEKPFQDFLWEVKFELTDEQFDTEYEKNRQRQLRLISHQEYELRKKKLHACLWHYDKTLPVVTEAELNDPENRPRSQPLGVIWEPGTIIPAVGLQGGPYADFEARVAEFMRATQMPAISIAYAVKGRLVYQAAFGYADVGRLKKATPEDAFRTVWLSKLITAIATLQLVEQGKLKLDDPVYPLLKIKPWQPATVDARINQVTIKQLLQSTGGHDPALTKDPLFNSDHLREQMKIDGEVTAEHAIKFMMSQTLGYEPGTKKKTSHYGYFLLGRVIEEVSGMSYEDYVLENIAKPAKLTSLAMSQTDQSMRPSNSVMHYSRGGAFYKTSAGKDFGKWALVDTGSWNFGLIGTSYGWLSTPADLLAFGSALQANPSPLLSNELKSVLVAMPDFELQQAISAKPTTWSGMGLGVRTVKNGGMDFWMESRGTSSTNSLVCYASGDLRCFMMNCSDTADGSRTYSTFAPIASEGFKVAVKLHRR